MTKDYYLSNALHAADDKAAYDAGARMILADKQVLAWILKYCVKEFQTCSIEQIMDCIEGKPEIAIVPVLPGRENSEAITGMATEEVIPNEGGVRFDIRFYAITPNGESIKLIIDVEAQREFHPGYSIVTRGIFYCARMISAQYGKEFTADNYDNIKKVYSIWICMDASKQDANTITGYSVEQNNIYGDMKGKQRYDLLSVVLIGLDPNGEAEQGTELHKMLSVLLSQSMKPTEKEKRLQEEFDIKMDEDMKGAWRTMCNLSDLIEERGIERGIEKGIERGQLTLLSRLIDSEKLTKEEAAAMMNMTVEELEGEMEALAQTV